MLLSLERRLLSVPSSFPAGALRAFRQGLSTHRPAGVGDHVQTGIGVPQELGAPVVSTENDPDGATG